MPVLQTKSSATARPAKALAKRHSKVQQVFFSDSLKGNSYTIAMTLQKLFANNSKENMTFSFYCLAKGRSPRLSMKSEISDLPVNPAIVRRESPNQAFATPLSTANAQATGI
jgi:hypothetical protein